MSLIQNCDELPLSLLYNTGPRLCIIGCPELGWIPEDIKGDRLVAGAAIRRIHPERTSDRVTFIIERLDRNQESLLVLRTLPGQCIPYEGGIFAVRNRGRPYRNANQEYIIEIQRAPINGPDEEENQRIARGIYGQSEGACIVIDLACGTLSHQGFAGRGARFYSDTCGQRVITLMYDAPLVAWTAAQWLHKRKSPPTPDLSFDVIPVAPFQKVVLNYGTIRTPVITYPQSSSLEPPQSDANIM
jgi:hypothetical protein